MNIKVLLNLRALSFALALVLLAFPVAADASRISVTHFAGPALQNTGTVSGVIGSVSAHGLKVGVFGAPTKQVRSNAAAHAALLATTTPQVAVHVRPQAKTRTVSSISVVTVGPNTSITLDGQDANLSDLKKGMTVQVFNVIGESGAVVAQRITAHSSVSPSANVKTSKKKK